MQPQIALLEPVLPRAGAAAAVRRRSIEESVRGEKVIEDAQRVLDGFKDAFRAGARATHARQARPRPRRAKATTSSIEPSVRSDARQPRRFHADVPQSGAVCRRPTRAATRRCATCSSIAPPSTRGRTTTARGCRKKRAATPRAPAAMNRVNPKYVLAQSSGRNRRSGRRKRRTSPKSSDWLHVLRRPFDEQPEFEAYAGLPPDWASDLEVSCSS